LIFQNNFKKIFRNYWFPSPVFFAAVTIKEEEVRSRSSTNSSLEFIDDYFGDTEVKKEWEVRLIRCLIYSTTYRFLPGVFRKINQTFHYTRRITPKRVTSWRCPTPRRSARQHSYADRCIVEAAANRLQRCVRFSRFRTRPPAYETRALTFRPSRRFRK